MFYQINVKNLKIHSIFAVIKRLLIRVKKEWQEK